MRIALISSTIPWSKAWLKMNVKLLPRWVEANLTHFCVIPVVDILRFIALMKSWTRILLNEKLSRNDRLIYGLVLQRPIYNQLYTFLEKHNALYKYQVGFRKGFSTEQGILGFTDSLKMAIYNIKIACGIFLDLSKPFQWYS